MFLVKLILGIFKGLTRLILSLLSVVLLAALFLWWANSRTSSFAEPYLYDQVAKVPYTRVALVPGTSAYRAGGGDNPYFTYRIEAAAALYKARRIRIILVSGDNGNKEYNEPLAMQKALIAKGVPKANIVLDYAGFRTLDTVIRCRDVFGQNRVVFISQPFQNARAVYIGRHNQMDIIAFNAGEPQSYAGSFTQVREWMARGRMMLDVHLLNTAPRFLGEQVPLPR
ncbi:MAG: YdcF family protein [Bacteroidetes bacterium]|nr:YdcF family protein [Bacteroidota bacterium]